MENNIKLFYVDVIARPYDTLDDADNADIGL